MTKTFFLFFCTAFLYSCGESLPTETMQVSMPRSAPTASYRSSERLPFFERSYKAERVEANPRSIEKILREHVRNLMDDPSAPFVNDPGTALYEKLRRGDRREPVVIDIDDGMDNDLMTVRIESIRLAGDPVLLEAREGFHTRSMVHRQDDGEPIVENVQQSAVLYSYSAVYRVLVKVDFDDQDGFSGEDRSERMIIDFPVTVRRLSEWK